MRIIYFDDKFLSLTKSINIICNLHFTAISVGIEFFVQRNGRMDPNDPVFWIILHYILKVETQHSNLHSISIIFRNIWLSWWLKSRWNSWAKRSFFHSSAFLLPEVVCFQFCISVISSGCQFISIIWPDCMSREMRSTSAVTAIHVCFPFKNYVCV